MMWLEEQFITILADDAETKQPTQISQTTAIIFVVIAILALIMAIGVFIFYLYMKKRQAKKVSEDFQVKQKKARYSVYNFWINYVYIFLIIVGIITTLILLPIGITNLV